MIIEVKMDVIKPCVGRGVKQSMHDNEPTDVETLASPLLIGNMPTYVETIVGSLLIGNRDMQCPSKLLISEVNHAKPHTLCTTKLLSIITSTLIIMVTGNSAKRLAI